MPNYQVQLLNTQPYNRTSTLVTVGVPFAIGEITSSSTSFVVSNALTNGQNRKAQWYPMGPQYHDGSYKYGRFSFLADMTANSDKQVTISTGTNYTSVPFVETPAMLSSVHGSATFGLILLDTMCMIDLSNATVVEGGTGEDVYKRYKKFQRHTAFPEVWIEVVFDVISNNSNNIRFWYNFGYCYAERNKGTSPGLYPYAYFPGPRTPSGFFSSLSDMPVIWVQGGYSTIQDEDIIFPGRTHIASAAAYITMNPVGNAHIGHNKICWGQNFNYKGVLYINNKDSDNANADYVSEIYAMSLNWYPDRFPHFYSLPDYPSYITTTTDAKNRLTTYTNSFINQQRAYSGYGIFGTIWGNIPNAPAAGDQGHFGYAFGVLRGWPWLRTGWPIAQKSIQLSNLSYGLHCAFIREADGTKFQYNNHPGVLIWVTNLFINSANPQRLGLGASSGDPQNFTQISPYRGEQFLGPDRQHGTYHMLMYDALVTGNWSSVDLCEYIAEMSIAEHDIHTISPSINGIDTSRGVGRGIMVLCAMYEVTAKSQILDILEDRINNAVYPVYVAHGFQGGSPPSKVRMLQSYFPDNLTGALKENTHWRAWEDTIASFGLYAAMKLFQRHRPTSTTLISNVNEMVKNVAASVTLFGTIDARTTFQNIVIGQWTGTLSQWVDNPAVTITSTTASGRLGALDYLNNSDAGATATSTVSAVPVFSLLSYDVTGQFQVGQRVTLGNGAQGTIVARNNGLLGQKALADGFGVPGLQRGDPIPTSLWNDRTTALNAAPFYRGLLKYIGYYYGYDRWQAASFALAQEYALAGAYGSDSAYILGVATDYLNVIKAQIVDPGNTWDEVIQAYVSVNPNAGQNITSSSTNINVPLSIPRSLSISKLVPTINAEFNVSATINATYGTFYLIKLVPQITASVATVNNVTIGNGKPSFMQFKNITHAVSSISIVNTSFAISATTTISAVNYDPAVIIFAASGANRSVSKILTTGIRTSFPGVGPVASNDPFDAPATPYDEQPTLGDADI